MVKLTKEDMERRDRWYDEHAKMCGDAAAREYLEYKVWEFTATAEEIAAIREVGKRHQAIEAALSAAYVAGAEAARRSTVEKMHRLTKQRNKGLSARQKEIRRLYKRHLRTATGKMAAVAATAAEMQVSASTVRRAVQ